MSQHQATLPEVVCCQHEIAWEDKPATFGQVRRLLEASPPAPGSLLLLPEMFSTGFSMNVDAIAEGQDRLAERFLADLARQWKITVLAGVVTRGADGRGANQALALGPDGAELARYTKIHPFSYGGEDQHYRAGDRLGLFGWGAFTVAPFVCYDLRFPEVFRSAVRRGAQVLAVIANWPAAREGHWLALLRARAIENQAYVVAVNRTGRDPRHAYTGRSLVVDPRGEVVADAGDQPGVIRACLDATALQTYRREFPALADMRWQDRPEA